MMDEQEINARLAAAGRAWLDANGINMTDAEIVSYHEVHLPIFARLGVRLSGATALALLRAYMQKKSPLTEQEILALVPAEDR